MFFKIPYAGFVNADADGGFVHFGGVDNAQDVFSLLNVPRVQSDLGRTGFDGFDGAIRAEVHVGNERYIHLLNDLSERHRVGASRHGESDQLTAGFNKLMDLAHAPTDIHRGYFRHGLDSNRSGRTDLHRANLNDFCFSSFDHVDIVVCLTRSGKGKGREVFKESIVVRGEWILVNSAEVNMSPGDARLINNPDEGFLAFASSALHEHFL